MNEIKAIMWKDIRQLTIGKKIIYSIFLIIFVLFLFGTQLLKAKNVSENIVTMVFLSLTSNIFFLSMLYLTGQIFRDERKERTLPTLLAAPLNVKNMFLAKFFVTFIFSCFMEFIIVVISLVFFFFSEDPFPTIEIIVISLVTIPIVGFDTIELVGLLYILISDLNFAQVVSMIIFVAVMVFSYSHFNDLVNFSLFITLIGVGVAFLLYFVIGKIDKEKIMGILS